MERERVSPAAIVPGCRRWLPLWAVVAVVNVGLGVVLSSDPQRANDFETVRSWTTRWLFDGADLYTPPDSGTDYPPHAVVACSPISLLRGRVGVAAWAALNLVFLVAAPILAARAVQPRARPDAVVCLIVLFLAWSGTRTLLQFSLLALIFGLAAMTLADRRRGLSGFCLGLAMMKPQIGVPFFLWTLLTRRWRVAVFCGLTILAGTLLFCIRAGVSPVRVATRYPEILKTYYWDAGAFVGVTKLEPLVGAWLPPEAARMTVVVASVLLLSLICFEGWNGSRRGIASVYPAPALAAIWSLLTFYHLTYNMVVLLPAAAALLFADDERTARLRRTVFWLMQFVLVLDVAGASRRLEPLLPWAGSLRHYHRVALLFLFAAFWLIHRQTHADHDKGISGV